MENKEIILLVGLLALAAVMFIYYSKCKRPIPKILFGFGSGLLVLYPVQWILGSMGYAITFNIFTASVSVILGIPGVALLVAAAIL